VTLANPVCRGWGRGNGLERLESLVLGSRYIDLPSREGRLLGQIGNDPRTLGTRGEFQQLSGFGPDRVFGTGFVGEPAEWISSCLPFRCTSLRTAF
jgi:hypothetical protein